MQLTPCLGDSTIALLTKEPESSPVMAMSSAKRSTPFRKQHESSRLSLPQVTLVLIETQENALAALAVKDCLRHADFGDVLIFTNNRAPYLNAADCHWSAETPCGQIDGHPVRFVDVPNWDSKLGWSEFSWHGVHEHLTTPHALYIQWDSWIIDPSAWKQEFLDYDIVGAPWWYEENNVGGLGFSLRSKRLLQYLAEHSEEFPIITDFDDDLICRKYRQRLESAGFNWAPIELAWDFAFECLRPPNVLQRHFGFHGIGNWPLILPWDRLQERARLAMASEYLRYSGHMSALADLLLRYATDHQQRIDDLNKNATEAHYFSAVNRLRCEDYENGLPAYEVRWDTHWFADMRDTMDRFKACGIPQWKGEDLNGKSIFVWHEQGHGDSIIMQRYLPLIEQRAKSLMVGVPKPLVSLFEANGHRVFDTLPGQFEFDYHCPMYSLPLAFGTRRESVPPPCLKAPDLPPRIARTGRPLVGVYWHASSKFPHNDHRSMPFATMAEALPPGNDYVALQYDLEEAGTTAAELTAHDIQHVSFADFGELAALINEVDLVICVCSGIANIAGSLRKPMWVLLSGDRFRDMRWGKAGNPSPWYPSARMFRQANLGDWGPVTREVRNALDKLATDRDSAEGCGLSGVGRRRSADG